MRLNWIKCVEDKWCPFHTVNLDHPHFDGLGGVYVIWHGGNGWHGGNDPWTVYVGSGQISARLAEHRTNPDILKYSDRGLFVIWARVAPESQTGVEAYLGDELDPLESIRLPDATPIPVNLPW